MLYHHYYRHTTRARVDDGPYTYADDRVIFFCYEFGVFVFRPLAHMARVSYIERFVLDCCMIVP